MTGYGKSRQQYRPRPPAKPINMAFGLLPSQQPKEEPPPKPEPPKEPLGRSEIVGTLTMKGQKLDGTPPLAAEYLAKLEKNLKAIYEDGRFSSSKSVVDFKEGELLVSFPYNQAAVERIKGFDKNERAWDPDERCWRVFVGCFDDVFDVLGRGLRLTEPAYEAIVAFIRTPYYAAIGRGKMAKLILREAWFEQLDFEKSNRPKALFGSNAHLGGEPCELPGDVDLENVKNIVNGFSYGRKPFTHQIQGIEFLIVNPEAALLDEMGCGKSFQIASAIAVLMKTGELDGAMVVAPMSLLRTWQEELRLAGINDFSLVVGTPKQREKALASKARILVIHYEGMRLEAAALAEWLKERKAMLVFDESQRIKNLNAQTTQAAQQLRPHAQRCVIATGTPIANRPLDLFSQYLVLDKGKTFGTKFPTFKNTFCEIETQKIQVGRKKITVERFLGVRNGPELHSRITRTSLRRLKSQVLDLPPVIYKDYIVELKGVQKTMYMQMRDNLKVEIQGMSASEVSASANSIAVKLLRLAQISSNPRLVSEDFDGPNVKMSELEQILEDIFADDTKKVILWSHFVENVQYLVEQYGESYGAVGHTGDMSVEERSESINRFRDDPTARLFIATPQSAKEGLTLLPRDGRMVADTMIYLDLSFDSASYVQSQARFHRIGQTAEHCLVIHVVGEGTVDEYIRRTIVDKLKTANQVLDANASVSALVSAAKLEFSRDELLKVL